MIEQIFRPVGLVELQAFCAFATTYAETGRVMVRHAPTSTYHVVKCLRCVSFGEAVMITLRDHPTDLRVSPRQLGSMMSFKSVGSESSSVIPSFILA